MREGLISPLISDASTVPAEVLRAFDADGIPVRLPGGQGQSFRCGNLVLKPAVDDEETNWIAQFYLEAPRDGFRLPVPVRSRSGEIVYAGWQAWEALEGQAASRGEASGDVLAIHPASSRPDASPLTVTIELCQRFHRTIAQLPRPSYFDNRPQNPWVVADQVAYDERSYPHHPRFAPVIEPLRGCLRPLECAYQLIHGDFGGNVLFADGLPPAVIDFSPYWRPAGLALGVVVADAIVWEGADLSLIEACSQVPDFVQHLARAELRRLIELETLHDLYGWEVLHAHSGASGSSASFVLLT